MQAGSIVMSIIGSLLIIIILLSAFVSTSLQYSVLDIITKIGNLSIRCPVVYTQ